MKYSPKFLIIAAVFVCLITAGGLLFRYIPGRSGPEEREIIIRHNLPENILPALSRSLDLYRQSNLHVTITERKTDIPDIIISSIEYADISLETEYSLPRIWTGNLWTLAVNKRILQAKGIPLPNDSFEFHNLEEFTEFLDVIKNTGLTPLAVGNSHGWPLTLWDQHLTAMLNNGRTPLQPDQPDTTALPESWLILKDWMGKGYFLKDVLNEGWARGLLSVVEGKAAVTLMSGSMLSTIPPENRSDFHFLPFPSSTSSNSWIIGSGYYLSYRKNEKTNEISKLTEYLFSPSVTAALAGETGSIFYSGNSAGRHTQLGSWSSAANSPEMREYMNRLKEFVYR